MKFPAAVLDPSNLLAELLEADFSEWPELKPALEPGEARTSEVPSELWERALLGPARDFLRRPGKEFRARLVESTWTLAGGSAEAIPPELPLLVEILHAGSLIIDDIQDGSSSRRGDPCLHQRYGTPVAINTGNWLYYWPFVLLGRLPLDPAVALELYRQASLTMLRCHQGQALDLSAVIFELGAREIPSVVMTATRLKTGALMEFAARLGAVAAGAGGEAVERLGHFGRELGIGLQMLDDLGGLLSTSRRQKGYEDLRLGRPTWPWSWAVEDACEVTFAKLLAHARDIHAGGDPELVAAPLRELLGQSGPARVRAHLGRTRESVSEHFGQHPSVTAIDREIARLEKSYV